MQSLELPAPPRCLPQRSGGLASEELVAIVQLEVMLRPHDEVEDLRHVARNFELDDGHPRGDKSHRGVCLELLVGMSTHGMAVR